MLKKYTSLPIVIVVLITAALLLWIILANKPESAGRESVSAGGQSSSLTVSQDGSQTSTNVPGLQEGAQSGGGVNPQQSLSSQ